MGIFSALGRAAKSNTAGAISEGLLRAGERRRTLGAFDDQKQQAQAEKEFSSAFNSRLLQGDVDGAVKAIQEYGGRVSPRALTEARQAVTEAQLRKATEQRQGDAEQSQRTETGYMADAFSRGVSPEDATLLRAGQQGGRFYEVLRNLRKRMDEKEKPKTPAVNPVRIGPELTRFVDPTNGRLISSFPGLDTGKPGDGTPGALVGAGGEEKPGITLSPRTPTSTLFSYIFQRTGKAVPVDVRKKMDETDNALTQLDKVEQIFEQNKDLLGMMNKIPGVATTRALTDPNFAKMNAAFYMFKQTFGKASEGGVLRAEDEIKYDKMVPLPSDTGVQAQAKLEVAKEALLKARLLYSRNIISGLTGDDARVSFEEIDKAMGGKMSKVAEASTPNDMDRQKRLEEIARRKAEIRAQLGGK